MNYYVEIVKYDNEEIIKRIGPMSKKKAERVDNGVNINLNHKDYYTKIVEED